MPGLSALRAFVIVTSVFAATGAHATQLACSSDAVSVEVDVDPSAGTCAVNGQRAMLRKPFDPVVCHLSTPQLSILTIERNGGFTWEDTNNAQISRGTCERI